MKVLQQGGWWDEGQRAAAATGSPDLQTVGSSLRPARFEGSEQEYPFYLVVFPHNTLGTGDGAHLPWLQATPDPTTSIAWQTWVEVNPKVAEERGLREGDVVTLTSPQGSIEVPVYISPAAPPDVLAVPLGQGHTGYGRYAEKRGVNPAVLLVPLTDETTGSLAYGATRVRMASTGRRISVAKFEGNVPAYQIPGDEVVPVTRGDT
jgi:anaerobic selenocysteine-containing dehydrogenase